jgi:hypothetical protein
MQRHRAEQRADKNQLRHRRVRPREDEAAAGLRRRPQLAAGGARPGQELLAQGEGTNQSA